MICIFCIAMTMLKLSRLDDERLQYVKSNRGSSRVESHSLSLRVPLTTPCSAPVCLDPESTVYVARNKQCAPIDVMLIRYLQRVP